MLGVVALLAAATAAVGDNHGAVDDVDVVERWGRWEHAWRGPSAGLNPFVDVELIVVLKPAGAAAGAPVTVRGFYDGGGQYRARVMPPTAGGWIFATKSNVAELDGQRGAFTVRGAAARNHGPVVAKPGQTKFANANGTPFFAVATTVYGMFLNASETLESLKAAPFNKVRKLFAANVSVYAKLQGNASLVDPTRFNPDFFRGVEATLGAMGEIGVEAELSLFMNGLPLPQSQGCLGGSDLATCLLLGKGECPSLKADDETSSMQRGAGFGGGALSLPAAPLGSVAAEASLKALAAVGADHVRLFVTYYQDSLTAAKVYGYSSSSGSPLATESGASLRATMAAAQKLGLKVMLSPRLDLNWDRVVDVHLHPRATTGSAAARISPPAAALAAWFASYTSFVRKYAAECGKLPSVCTQFLVADSLEATFAHSDQWRAVIAAVRQVLPASTKVVIASADVSNVAFWKEVDVIGVNAMQTPLFQPTYTKSKYVADKALSVAWPDVPFGIKIQERPSVNVAWTKYAHNVTLAQCRKGCNVAVDKGGACDEISFLPGPGVSQCYLFSHVVSYKPSVPGSGWASYRQSSAGWPRECTDASALHAAWKKTGLAAAASAASKQHAKPFIVTAFGSQSRPQAHRSPAGIGRPGHTDCSPFNGCYAPECQANMYSSFIAEFAAAPGFSGAYAYLWSSDPTQGGLADSSFSPRGKPAEGVLRKWWGAATKKVPPVDVFYFMPKNKPASLGHISKNAPGVRNGYVFGTGEWSNPAFSLDSAQSRQSIDNAVSKAGVNALEFMATWYFANKDDTLFYPSTNATSPTRTATDKELISIMRYAKSKNLTVAFTPFLDPFCNDHTFCAQQNLSYIENGLLWRGQVGDGWSSNSSQWAAFFNKSEPHSYYSFILRFAKIAQQAGADEYFVSHEDVQAVKTAPAHYWRELVRDVRKVFKGKVATALNWGPFISSPFLEEKVFVPVWLEDLDYLGVDCYFPNAQGQDVNNTRPWNDLPKLSDLVAGWHTPIKNYGTKAGLSIVDAMSNYSKLIGSKQPAGMMEIVCTEVGYQSKPAPWVNPAGTDQPDDASCDVQSQCVNTKAQALTYETLFSALYPQKWFKGFYLWLWRADPSSGGMSDDQFGPQGKVETMHVLNKYWKSDDTVEVVFACTTDLDCNNGGSCSASTSTCSCDATWRGPSCAELALQPAASSNNGDYNYVRRAPQPHKFTWGGSVVADSDSQTTWHMFASMFDNATLSSWESKSIVVRMESNVSIDGPYVYKDTVAAPRTTADPPLWDSADCHNPTVHRIGNEFVVFYIGVGVNESGANSDKPQSIGAAFATSPRDPWTRLKQPLLVADQAWECGGASECGVSNPAIVVRNDSSVLMFYRGNNDRGVGVASASTWRGPYKKSPESVHSNGIFKGDLVVGLEDMYAWQNPPATHRDGCHMVLHQEAQGVENLGAHAFTADPTCISGWQLTKPRPSRAYGPEFAWDNGTTTTFGSRERPQIVLNAATGEPTHLSNGFILKPHAGGGWNGASFTLVAPIATKQPHQQQLKSDDALPSLECELNGVHSSAGCTCYDGWIGPTCGTLDLEPGSVLWPAHHPDVGSQEWWGPGDTPSAWGGTIQHDVEGDGKFHLVAATGCYLPARIMHMDGWQISSGSSDKVEGPYKYDGLVSKQATAFGPHSARLPDGRFLVYFEGARTVPTDSGYNATCTGNEKPPKVPATSASAGPPAPAGKCTVDDCYNAKCQPQRTSGAMCDVCSNAGCVCDPGFGECYPPAYNKTSSITVRISSSMSGPWENITHIHIEGMDDVMKLVPRVADNISPLVIKNSSSPSGYTILLAFRFPGSDSWCGKARCAPSVIGLAKAEHWAGPYVSQGKKDAWPSADSVIPYIGDDFNRSTYPSTCFANGQCDGGEDPTMFIGRNGTVHLLFHKYNSGPGCVPTSAPGCCKGPGCKGPSAPGWPGLHAFSRDGAEWHVSPQLDGRGAYSFLVPWAAGGETLFARRERPELTVDPATGSPLWLNTGCQLQPNRTKGGGGCKTCQYSYVVMQKGRHALNQK